jgi:hypothetical protein
VRAVIILALFTAAPAAAQTAFVEQGTRAAQIIQVSGTAEPACLARPAGAQTGSNATFLGTASSGTVTIGNLADPVTAQALPSRITLMLPIICNSAHVVRLRSVGGALRREGAAVAAGSAFADQLPYQYGLRWAGGGSLSPQQSSQPLAVAANGAASGMAEVTLEVSGGGRPLVAGRYGDIVIVELGAAE